VIYPKEHILAKALISVWIVLLFFNTSGVFAQGNPSPTKPQEVKTSGYPVMLGDQTLYHIRDIKGYSAEERAKTVIERIKKVAEDPRIPTTLVTTSTYDHPITFISIGSELLMAVFDEDAKAEGQTRQELAKDYTQKLKAAIEKYREERSLKRILTGSLFALIATILLITFLFLLNKFYRKTGAWVQGWISSKKISLHIQSFELIQAERIKVIFTGAMKIIRVLIVLILIYVYVHVGLSLLPWTQPFADKLLHYVLVPLKTIGNAVLDHVPNLLFIAIIVLITVYILKLMNLFFKEIERGAIAFKGFYPEWAKPTYRICRLLVIAFAAVMAFPYIPGSDSPAFKGISIFLGVVFSLGSTSFIANILAGYTLTYRRVFKIGDRVKIADFTGDVVETRLQVTHLRTIKNEEIVVPNSMIVNSHVINYSSLAREKGLILHTIVTIGYDAPWRQVHAMLLMAAEKTPGLLREPAPFVLQKSLDDFYVTYELNAYTNRPLEMAEIYSALHKNVQDAFNEYGVQIMSPSYWSDPNQVKIVPKERWYTPPAKPPDDSGKED
jgi:small-conductance mechanosensitive channel